jgi:mannose/fructose-specific phosphotransferase system component IIA
MKKTADAVLATEAVLARKLSVGEMSNVHTIVQKGLSPNETWLRILDTVGATPTAVAKSLAATSIRWLMPESSDAVISAMQGKTSYAVTRSAIEAVLGRQMTEKEAELVKTIVARSAESAWDRIFDSLEIAPEGVAKRALTLQIQAAAGENKNYEAVAKALREDVETRLRRAGMWES